jgi:hypothetical protein
MAGAYDGLVQGDALEPALARKPQILALPPAVALTIETLGNFFSFSGGSPQKIVETIRHSSRMFVIVKGARVKVDISALA